jgi:carbon storage regulator CsrA
MLVLTRKPEEQIRIGDDIVITIVRVKGNTIRVGIDAPKGVRIVRGELDDKPDAKSLSESDQLDMSPLVIHQPERKDGRERNGNVRSHGDRKGQGRSGNVPSSNQRNGDRHTTNRLSNERMSGGPVQPPAERGINATSPLGSFVLAARIPLADSTNTLNSRVG